MADTFRIPADVAAHCIKAGYVLASSERMLRREYDLSKDDTSPDWSVFVTNEDAKTCADNLKTASEFLHWLGQFAEDDPQPELVKLDPEGGAA